MWSGGVPILSCPLSPHSQIRSEADPPGLVVRGPVFVMSQ